MSDALIYYSPQIFIVVVSVLGFVVALLLTKWVVRRTQRYSHHYKLRKLR